jgi:hypothetical protein
MNVAKYSELPDSMESEDLAVLFHELLDYADFSNSTGGISSGNESLNIAEALTELADRQWHTYEKLDVSIQNRIEKWIQSTWNVDSYELVTHIILVVAHLGLVSSFQLIKNSLQLPLSLQVKNKIEKAVAELDDNIGDPYTGMK